jgi:hypothetical protein
VGLGGIHHLENEVAEAVGANGAVMYFGPTRVDHFELNHFSDQTMDDLEIIAPMVEGDGGENEDLSDELVTVRGNNREDTNKTSWLRTIVLEAGLRSTASFDSFMTLRAWSSAKVRLGTWIVFLSITTVSCEEC